MDNTSNATTTTTATAKTNNRKLQQTATTNKRKNRSQHEVEEEVQEQNDEINEGSGEVWETFDTNFKQVQSVLDRNRVLIQQVNENHQSRTADNMVKNVALIQEINGNIHKVVSLYSDFSGDFSSAFHDRDQNEVAGRGERESRGA